MKIFNKRKVILFAGLFVFLLLIAQCTSPTGPISMKDPLTYNWTIDTLKDNYLIHLEKFWANSNNDVYAYGLINYDDTKSPIWHYNGLGWQQAALPVKSDYIASVFGFSFNNVWAIALSGTDTTIYKSYLLHFDGTKWQNYSTFNGTLLKCMWGSSPKDVWTGGDTLLLHFNGSNWNQFPFILPSQGVSIQTISGSNSKDVYLTGFKPGSPQPFEYLYKYNGSQWSMIDSVYSSANTWTFGVHLETIGNEIYSYYPYLYKMGGNETIKINEKLTTSLGGTASDYLFASGSYDDGTINYYNGVVWNELVIKEGFYRRFDDIWTDGNEMFLVANDGNKTYLVHGKYVV
ncbi:MAG TPA: hypothetical protein VKA26_02440 [Ignavibacteriaceae bacterium]|nr:hypothetical protein [Ignavibacteriaceae bacterium]